jgi:predicted transcriptional regulator YdeE
MATTLVFVTAFCLVAVLVYMARYSGRVRVTRTRLIDAPLEAVFEQVLDFSNWNAWNPWLAHDANIGLPFKGTHPGSQYTWDSPQANVGMFELLRSNAAKSIQHKLQLKQPFMVRGRSQWTFALRDGKTEVNWQISARVAFTMRAFSQTVKGALELDCQYGLDRLASLLEPASAARYQLTVLGPREVPACRYVYQTYQGSIKGLPDAVRQYTTELRDQLNGLGIHETGEALAFYLKTNIKLRTTTCLIGLPIDNTDVGPMAVREMPAHRAFGMRLQGSNEALEIAWYHAMQRLTAAQFKSDQRLPPFERYLLSTDKAPSNDCVTEVNIPLLT